MNAAKKGRLIAWMASIAVLASPVVAVPAFASPTGDNVVINEIYARGGSANAVYTSKFVELYNPTGSPIDLAGMSLQYFSANNTTAGQIAPLSGSVPAEGCFLIELGSNGSVGEKLPTPDLVNPGVNPGGTNGTVALINGTEKVTLVAGDTSAQDNVVDAVGYGTAKLFEGAAASSAGGNQDPRAWQRKETGVDTDNNAVDFSMVTPTPCNSTGEVPSPDPDPDPEPPATEPLTIAQIQGPGSATPYANQTVTTRGVVTAVYPTGGFNGAYIQTPGTGGANDDGMSDGIFVYSTNLAQSVEKGDYIEVTGTALEYSSLTEINVTSFKKLDEAVVAPTPVTLEQIPADEAAREALEGMLVEVTGPYTVTNNYSTNQYGQVGLAAGTEPLRQPSDQYNPTANPAEIAQLAADNSARLITLDDGLSWQYTGGRNPHPEVPLPYLSNESPVRVGAAVTFKQPFILDYRFQWNLQPTSPVTSVATGDTSAEYVVFENTRTDAPEEVGGDVTISSFNVLNYFTDLGEDEAGCRGYNDRDGNPVTANNCSVRGAYTREAFERQQTKIVKAINSLDASVVSLEEIENSAKYGHDRDESLAALVDALNADAGTERWAYVPSPAKVPADEDVIRLAFIYQKDAVTPVGESEILIGNQYFTGYAREPLAQAWQALGADGKPYGKEFVVVVNHFKSKGSLSTAFPSDTDPYQGNNNKLRVAQSQALEAWIGENFSDKPVFIVGDLNSYKAEDPIVVLEQAGYTEVTTALKVDKHSYQYSGTVGSLDHVLGNEAAMEMVTGADVWNINAMESIALEYSRYNYNVTNLWSDTPFRSSDHDPVKVGLKVADVEPAPGCGDSCNTYVTNSLTSSIAEIEMKLGDGEKLVGDWNGEGKDTFAIRNGSQIATLDGDGAVVETVTIPELGEGVLLSGDTDGDRKDEVIVHAGNVFTVYTADGVKTVSFGRAGDVPLFGDWDGDGIDTPAVRRGAVIYYRNDLAGGVAEGRFAYGRATDTPIVGDWDGDGVDTVSVRRDTFLHITNTLVAGPASATQSFGKVADTVFAGDWDGDRVDTLAVVR